jgi:hypothetical protein
MSFDSPTPDAQPTTGAPRLAGRYLLLDPLGAGGMGTVFRARDTKLDRPVAVKLLPQGSAPDPDAVARFRREARALARLTHPGIIQAYDSGEDGGRPFLVMELVEGQSLSALLRAQGRLSPTRAADFAYQAARALHHAHKSGLVHRDVKPSNLLLSADGRLRLLDLGLARFLQDQIGEAALTRTGTGLGTPDYAPPEQFRDARTADARSDVYSLGCTLYHLIAGRVPFPGSSFSEKVEAHESREPAPLEEVCPEVPAGLALAVGKMMAKRPADRFQTMAEVAEALAPYVAGSSASFPQIRNTATWDGSRLATMPAYPRRRRLGVLVAASAAVLLLAAGMLVGLAAGWFRPGTPQVAQGGEPPPAPADTGRAEPADGGERKPPDEPGKAEPKPEAPAPADDPDVLTVSQKKEGGGKYRSITQALEAVRPGQTIRVIDAGTYTEALLLNRPSAHANITLEAPGGAALEFTTNRGTLLEIAGVSGVTVRDFRLRARGTDLCALVYVHGEASGVVLERLDLGPGATGGGFNGVEVENLAGRGAGAPPGVTARHCVFRKAETAVNVMGINSPGGNYGRPTPVNDLLIRDNEFIDCHWGVILKGSVRRARVVGNRFRGCTRAACQLEHLLDDADDILVANNTAFECGTALRLWDDKIRTKGVRYGNNVSLAGAYPDLLVLDGANPLTAKGVGDGAAYAARWDFRHNWREAKAPDGPPRTPDGWVPPDPKKGDVLKAKIDGVNRDPKSPDFLRPDRDSPLTTDGAGKDDPALPCYVGALPPEGTEPWDWDRAGRLPKDVQLLTVSKDEKGGGKFRTINDALKAVTKPLATVRVLDAETYPETIRLDEKERHEGLLLEAPKRATILLAGTAGPALAVQDVPGVRVRGFRLRPQPSRGEGIRVLVQVKGDCPGVRLEGLQMHPTALVVAVNLQDVAGSADQPVCVTGCRIDSSEVTDGVVVMGAPESGAVATRHVSIRGNRLVGGIRGVHLQGAVADVQVTGNHIADCSREGIGLHDLTANAGRLLVANNTIFNCTCGLRGWVDPTFELRAAQAAIHNNLVLQNTAADMAVFVGVDDGGSGNPSQEQGKRAAELWRFGGNWRDLSGLSPHIPLGSGDHKLDSTIRLPRDTARPDFLRPSSDSPLATGGAGKGDLTLPAYVGAVPPEGTEPWDWDRTWRARAKKGEDRK